MKDCIPSTTLFYQARGRGSAKVRRQVEMAGRRNAWLAVDSDV